MQINTNHEFSMHIANDPFLNAQLNDWARELYTQALDRDPVDASLDADVLAQVMADRLPSIYFDEPPFSSAADPVDAPSSSLWLVWALMQARSRDPFQAGAEAQELAVALAARAGRACALPYSRVMETLRPRLLQSALSHGSLTSN